MPFWHGQFRPESSPKVPYGSLVRGRCGVYSVSSKYDLGPAAAIALLCVIPWYISSRYNDCIATFHANYLNTKNTKINLLGLTQLLPHTSSQRHRLLRPLQSLSVWHFLKHLRFLICPGFRGHSLSSMKGVFSLTASSKWNKQNNDKSPAHNMH